VPQALSVRMEILASWVLLDLVGHLVFLGLLETLALLDQQETWASVVRSVSLDNQDLKVPMELWD